MDSGLNPGFVRSDAGGVDAENLDWELANHPDWILRDKDGNFIRSGASRLGNKGEYWPDPGSPGGQDYFAEKVLKLIRETGSQWNGVLLDQFMGTADGYERYAGADSSVHYWDLKGRPVQPPVVLKLRTAMLLMRILTLHESRQAI